MVPNGLLGRSTNCFVKSCSSAAGRGRWGDEAGPHWRHDAVVLGRITRKEVPHEPVYRTPAPLPDLPAPPPLGRPARAGPGHPPPRGLSPASPQVGRGHLEACLLHPLADLLGLLLASPQPRSFLPRRRQADRRLAGAPRREARRRGYQPVLQGPGPAARIGPVPLDAPL